MVGSLEVEAIEDPSEDPAPVLEPKTDLARLGIGPREWIGVIVVISLAVLPDLNNAITTYSNLQSGQALPTMPFTELMMHLVYRSGFVCAVTCVAIFALGGNWKETGFKLIRLRDVMWGFALYMAGTLVYIAVSMAIPDDWFFRPDLANVITPPSGPEEYPILLAGSLANGMGEELVVRAYLISRLEILIGSTWFAVLATSTMFASYHIYQGWESMIAIFALGLVYAFAFVRLRSIWPVFIAHALADFVGLLMLE